MAVWTSISISISTFDRGVAGFPVEPAMTATTPDDCQ